MADQPSLRETLEAAVEEHTPEPAEAPVAEKVETPAREAAAEPAADKPETGQPRAPDGKFAPKADKPAAIETKTEDGKTAVTEAEPAEKAEAKPVDLPHTMPEADKAELRKLPPEAQAIAAKHIGNAHRYISEQMQTLAEARQIEQFFAPYRQDLAMSNLTPSTVIQRWAAGEQALQRDFLAAVKKLAPGYLNPNVPEQAAQLAAIQALGAPAEEEYVDPEVKALREQLAQLQQGYGQVATHLTTQQQQQQRAAVQQFVDEKDAAGNLLRPFMSDEGVQAEMLRRAHFERQQGRTPDLQRLYDEAVWASPAVRDQLMAAETAKRTAAAAAKAQEEAKAKAEQARRAGVSVRGAPSPGATQAAPGTLRETLLAAAREHGATVN